MCDFAFSNFNICWRKVATAYRYRYSDNSEYIFSITNTSLFFFQGFWNTLLPTTIYLPNHLSSRKLLLILLKNELAVVIRGRIWLLGEIWVRWFSQISEPVNNMILYFRLLEVSHAQWWWQKKKKKKNLFLSKITRIFFSLFLVNFSKLRT